jgi:hypothetical protein
LLARVVKPRSRTLALLILLGVPLLAAVALARVITSALWLQALAALTPRSRASPGPTAATPGLLLNNHGVDEALLRPVSQGHSAG